MIRGSVTTQGARWRLVLEYDRDPVTGRRVRRSMSFPTRADAVDYAEYLGAAVHDPNPARFELAAIDGHLRQQAIERDLSVARTLAVLAEVDRSVAYRAIETGTLSVELADRVAIGLGLHPALLWPSWFPSEEAA